jgi:hypothetical protein
MKLSITIFVLLFCSYAFAQKVSDITDVCTFPKDYLNKNLAFENIYFRLTSATPDEGKNMILYMYERANSSLIGGEANVSITKNMYRQLTKYGVTHDDLTNANLVGKMVRVNCFSSYCYYLRISKIDVIHFDGSITTIK